MAHEITIKELVEAGAHFGHQTHRWNPKMKRFIFKEHNGLYIIDLAKTLHQVRVAVEAVKEVIAEGKKVLFVGTKKQAKSVVRECAEQSDEFYVCERWLGGLLTNLTTIRQSVKKLDRIEKQLIASGVTVFGASAKEMEREEQRAAEGLETEQEEVLDSVEVVKVPETASKIIAGLTKKEISVLGKQHDKLDNCLSGVRKMSKVPGLLIIVDPSHESLAVAEANKLGIPIIALVDTNCDPDPIQYVIPCNDDAVKSVRLIVQTLAQAIVDKKNELNISFAKGDEQIDEKDQEDADFRKAAASKRHGAPRRHSFSNEKPVAQPSA